MRERMFGIETEYALCALDRRGRRIGDVLEELMTAARRRPHLHGRVSSGVFFSNGARLYVDCGHPEYATPECVDPGDLVRHVLAGERILAEIARELAARHKRIDRALVFRTNVDYGGNGTTWGCHESYLHRADAAGLARELLPHLASRIIYTGAGGFDNRSAGIEFLVSPRVAHLEAAVSGTSTECRGIVHTKNEPLCRGGYSRLHLLCGESLCGHLGTWLKVAATALVVAMVEAGLDPGRGVALADPLDAMRAFARDPECRVEVAAADGRRLTALDIQRRYLELAEANVHRSFMPPWAEEACRQWRAILDRLAEGRAAVYTTLEWALKRELVERRIASRGFGREAIERWNATLTGRGRRPRQGAGGPDGLERFRELRSELFRLDLHFGELGDTGIFTSLDRDRWLDHAAPGVGGTAPGSADAAITEAVESPPSSGRARLRGEWVRKLAGGRGAADWDGVWDDAGGRFLDLGDPFASGERWRKASSPSRPDTGTISDILRRRLG